MYQQTQPAALATDPVNLLFPPLNFNPNNPPWVPQIEYLPPPMQQVYAFLVGTLMSELQSKASMNAARTHAYNMMAFNQFQNTEFVNITQLFVKYVDACMQTQQALRSVPVDQAVVHLVGDFVGAYCLGSVMDFQGLLQYLPREFIPEVQRAAGMMNSIMQLIQSVQANQRQVGQPMSSFGPGGMMTGHFPSHGQHQGHFQTQQPQGRQLQFGGQPVNVGSGGAAGLFDTTGNRQTPQTSPQFTHEVGTKSRFQLQLEKKQNKQKQPTQPVQDETGGMTAHFRPAGESVQVPARVAKQSFSMPKTVTPVNGYQQTQQVETQILEEPAEPVRKAEPVQDVVEVLEWKPSTAQPYPTLYDTTKFYSALTKVGNDVIQVTKKLTQEELEKMNPEDHALTRPPLPRYDATALDAGSAEEAVTDTVIAVPTFELEYQDDDEILELSADITKVMTGLRYRISTGGNSRAAAKCYPAFLVEPLAIESAEKADRYTKLVSDLRDCTSFEQAQKLLDSISDSAEDRRLFNLLDRLITNEINNLLYTNLNAIHLDSFYEDAHAILPEIRDAFNSVMEQAFASRQSLFFKQLVADISSDSLEKSMEFMLKEYIPENTDAKFVYLPWHTSFTHLMLGSWELNIKLAPGKSAALTETTTPELYALAHQILNKDDLSDARRHYIITSDGIQLILTRGYINDGAYLIRRAREFA